MTHISYLSIKAGDIVVSRGKGLGSWFIGFVSCSKWSHIGIAISDERILHATYKNEYGNQIDENTLAEFLEKFSRAKIFVRPGVLTTQQKIIFKEYADEMKATKLFTRIHAGMATLPAWVERNMVGLIDNFGMMLLPQLINDPDRLKFFTDMHWWVEDFSQATVPLLASDRPLWISTDLKKPAGLLALPLSPKKAFFASTNKQLQPALIRNGSSQLARRCNQSIVSQAVRFVYGVAEKKFIERRLR